MVNLQTFHRRAARVLPEVIKTSGVLLEDAGQNELAAMLFPLRRKSTGTLMFRLSGETRLAMGDQPLAYLRTATKAREGLGRLRNPFSYRPWRSASISCSPASPGRRAEGKPFQILYTRKTDGKAWMVVVPEEGWVLYAWRD